MLEWVMMGAFIAALGLSLWKLYLFFPNKPLTDDDTNSAAIEELTDLMICCTAELFESEQRATPELLYNQMLNHHTFDREHYWRFNQNRLNQLLRHYYLSNPSTSSLQDIYDSSKEKYG